MTLTELGAMGEFVGSIAVVISLIYLAVQVRQNTRSNMVSANIAATQSQADMLGILMRDDDLREIYQKGNQEYAALSVSEQQKYGYLMHQMCNLQSSMFHMHEAGLLDGSVWQEYFRSISRVHRRDGFREWWKSNSADRFSDEFIEFSEKIQQSGAET